MQKDLTPTDDPILVSELFSTEDQRDYTKIIKYHIMHYVSSPHGSGPQPQEGAVTSFLTFQLWKASINLGYRFHLFQTGKTL